MLSRPPGSALRCLQSSPKICTTVKRATNAFVLIPLVLLGCARGSYQPGGEAEPEAAGPAVLTELRVYSVNAWHGLARPGVFRASPYESAESRRFRFELLVSDILAASPDIVIVSELNPLPAQARELADRLGFSMVFDVDHAGWRIGPVGLPANLRSGTAILARQDLGLELVDRERLGAATVGPVVAAHGRRSPGILLTRISLASGPVSLATVHYPASPIPVDTVVTSGVRSYLETRDDADVFVRDLRKAVEGEQARLEMVRRTVDFLNDRSADAPVILAGTFNFLSSSPEAAILRNAGFADLAVTHGRGELPTYLPSANGAVTVQTEQERGLWGSAAVPGDRRIDFIMARGNRLSGIVTARVADVPTFSVYPSDHFGLFARIRAR